MPAPIGFLRSLIRREGPISIRTPSEADLTAVEKMMHRSPHTYSGYGGAMRESLRDDVFLTAWQEDRPAGLVMAHRQGPEVAWIHAFGVAEDVPLSDVANALIQALEERALEAGATQIAYMDEYGLSWLRRLLRASGFRRQTRVLGLEAPARTPPDLGSRAVQVRSVDPEDIPAVAELDQVAFGPLWAYNERILRNVLGQAACFDVAEKEGQLVGYVLGTLHGGARAHIVRLAVHPQWQGQRIGARLLAEAFIFFRSQGAKWIGLNTQEENVRSQRLYRAFGFRPTGEEVGVWTKELPGEGDTGGGKEQRGASNRAVV